MLLEANAFRSTVRHEEQAAALVAKAVGPSSHVRPAFGFGSVTPNELRPFFIADTPRGDVYVTHDGHLLQPDDQGEEILFLKQRRVKKFRHLQ